MPAHLRLFLMACCLQFRRKRFVAALSVAEPRHGWVLEQVLTPYLDGLEERMDELESGRRAIAGYVDTINSFFEGKTLDFLPATGVAITAKGTHDQLEPSQLSSGEKQILVLFSDVVALREERVIVKCCGSGNEE